MVLTKQVVVITQDILLILAAAFSPDVLLYNNIVNSLQNVDNQQCSVDEVVGQTNVGLNEIDMERVWFNMNELICSLVESVGDEIMALWLSGFKDVVRGQDQANTVRCDVGN